MNEWMKWLGGLVKARGNTSPSLYGDNRPLLSRRKPPPYIRFVTQLACTLAQLCLSLITNANAVAFPVYGDDGDIDSALSAARRRAHPIRQLPHGSVGSRQLLSVRNWRERQRRSSRGRRLFSSSQHVHRISIPVRQLLADLRKYTVCLHCNF